MIVVRKNPNMVKWFQVFSFGRIIDEVKKEARAKRIAFEEAKKEGQSHISFLSESIKVENK
jgi:hypothetical protein